jgi:hypothetical protein
LGLGSIPVTPTVLALLMGTLAGPLVGQSCLLHVDRVKPNGMFEFRITLHNPSEVPVRLIALHVSYATLTGPPYRKERRRVVSPFRQLFVVQPHQRVTLTTLPTMDAITDDPAIASASCSPLSSPGNDGRVGK